MQQSDSRGRPRSDSEPRSNLAKKARSESEPRVAPKKKVTRDSSVGSGREVRCGCQYFQSDSLLPERVTLVGRPPSRTSLGRVANMATTMGDHEYEPINPRPQPPAELPTPQQITTEVGVDEQSSPKLGKKLNSETSSIGSGDRNFVRISLHDENDVKIPDREAEEVQLTPQEVQTRMEERYFAATPTTTESRTDCDVNTSQLDSSGLEDLPLRRGSRKKKEEGEPNTRGFQQRIRSQAGRLRAKLRSMKMPERPKFNLPDRPKFNMPERPKFNLPERPKFNLPERPKFNLPERPKFNFPERPKFNMPSMPSFSRTKSAKATSSTRRPLRDRATNPSTESNASSSRKNLFDFDFKTYPRIFDRSRRKGDYATSSPKSTPRSQTPPPSMESTKKPKMPFRKKGPIGSRWVHKFSDIKYVDDEENNDEEFRHRRDSPDVRIIRLRDSTDEEREDLEEQERRERDEREEIEYALQRNQVRVAVEELERQRESIPTEPTTPFQDKDYGYAVTEVIDNKVDIKEDSLAYSDREQRSSGSSSDRHRAGVLEEIDSDEFFLREKGISHEDVDVGRYLTNEIRDAFRSPENALSKMDDKYYNDDDDEEEDNLGGQYRGTPEREPLPPVRTRSLKPRKRANKAPITDEEDTTHFFNTFPPARPTRNRRYQQGGSGADISKDEENIEEEEEEPVEAPPTFLITNHSEVSYETQDDDYRKKMDDRQWQDFEPIVVAEPPTAPKRVRRGRVEQAPESSFREHVRETKDNVSESSFKEHIPEELRNGHNAHNGWGDEKEAKMVQQEVFALNMEPDYIIPGVNEPEPVPIAPRRDRRKTSRGASLHSLANIDRTSLTPDHDQEHENVSQKEDEQRIGTVQLNEADLGTTGGYATVEKIYPEKPARPNRPKPPRPPAPTRRKRMKNFFSLPRKNTHAPPTRPLRNYSTLGPSRPARRDRTQRQVESVNRSGQEDMHGSNRDLSSGAVIRMMKGRPLPAPPRPPRKTKDQEGNEVEEEIFDEIAEPEIGSALGALNDTVFYTQKESGAPITFSHANDEDRLKQNTIKSSEGDKEAFLVPGNIPVESEYVEEVSIATQTDPLPEDFCMEVEEEEPRSHSDACTETVDTETTIPHTTEGRSESNTSSEVTPLTQTEAVNLGWMPEFSPAVATAPASSSLPAVPIAEPSLPPVNTVTTVEAPLPPPVALPVVEPQPPPPPTIIEREVPVYVLPDQDTVIELKAQRLQVSEMDVGKLNVGELSAQKILVSDIDGVSMQVAELSSKSGQLVLNGIELPPGFLQEIYDMLPRLRAATPQPEPAAVPSVPSLPPTTVPEPTPAPVPVPEPTPPSIPPHPMHIPMSPMYSFIPSAMRVPRSSIQEMDSEEEMISFIPASPRRRRHQHHVSKPVSSRYSSDEEEEVVSFQPRRQGVRADGGEPSVGQLGRQLVTAVQTSSLRAMRALLQYTATQLEGEDKRRELQTAVCILLVLVAGLILMGFGTGKTSHHHHWDYFNPPNN